jgi:hypothetical protein
LCGLRRICATLKQEFLPCMPFVMPAVFEYASKQPDWSILRSENGEAEWLRVASCPDAVS